jgi:hypothetical protein
MRVRHKYSETGSKFLKKIDTKYVVREDFLHYIWKHNLVASTNLATTQNEAIQVLHSGIHNHHSGPDFFNAQLIIGKQRWAGNIEIHSKSSDWYVHGHEKDSSYDTVILHVVWEHDIDIHRKDNSTIPTLELKKYIDKTILKNYQHLFSASHKWINCENDLASVDTFLVDNWLERLYIERLEQKSILIQNLLNISKNDWEAVLFKLLSKNFGLKVNGDAFLQLANSVDFAVIRKERHRLESLEALLFGQAGLLNDTIQDGYYKQLQKEYRYLQKKYHLTFITKPQFQFFRLRPYNFPTVRLAQLAALLYHRQNLFSKIMAVKSLKGFYALFDIAVSPYWKTHYSFTSVSKQSSKKLTKPFVDLVIINTIAPLQFIYLHYTHQFNEEALLNSLREINPEKNAIINKFKKLHITAENAMESQALLQLKNAYCSKQKCLQCVIGNALVTTS